MSEGTPKDPGQPRMPWEPETPAGGTPEPVTPPDTGWKPPEPTDPTTVWTPAPPTDQPASPPPPWQPPPPPTGQGGLITSAPVGWSAPPPAAAEIAPGLAFADTTSRLVAYLVDGVIVFFMVAIIGTVLGLSTTTVTDQSYSTMVSGPTASILYAVIGVAYFVVSWTGGRRSTIGQRLFHIQVGNAFDGRALTLEQAIRRWLGLGSWIGLLGIVPSLVSASGLIELLWVVILLITTATSPTKQGLHDRFANTALVRPSGQGTSGLATACIVIVGVLALLAVIGIVGLSLLGSNLSDILSEIGDSI